MTELAYGDDRHRLLLTAQAFEAACMCLDKVPNAADPTEAFAPLNEALWWGAAFDEGMRELEGETYEQRRDAATDGRAMPGIVFARNRGGHYRALMLRNRYGTELGSWILGKGQLGLTSRLVWRDRAELPPGRSNYGETAYKRHHEAQPVRDTMAGARRWIHGGARGEGPLFFPISSS